MAQTASWAVVAVFLVACTDESEPLNAIGRWNLTLTAGAGDCGLTGSFAQAYQVSDLGGGLIDISNVTSPSLITNGGQLLCSEDECSLSFVQTETTSSFETVVSFSLSTSAARQISGGATMQSQSTDGGFTCSQQLVASGTRAVGATVRASDI